MALVAACVLDPGVYFAMNSPAAVIGTTADSGGAGDLAAGASSITPEMLDADRQGHRRDHHPLARRRRADAGGRHGADPVAACIGGKAMMAFWYHFAILFEALFILTAVDAGTRVGRFMLQDLLGTFVPAAQAAPSPGRPTCSPPACAWRPGATSSTRAWSIRWAASTRCGRCSASPTRCWPASR